MTTLDAQITALLPGQEIEISRTALAYCTAERSGDGKTLRFIRYTNGGNSWTIYRQSRF